MVALLSLLLLSTSPAWCWDHHSLMTTEILEGYKARNPKLWSAIQAPVEVTSVESFAKQVLGEKCTLEKFKNDVLQGVGPLYQVVYPESYHVQIDLDWKSGTSHQATAFDPKDQSTSKFAVGRSITPATEVALFSDEPDWLMDDDVPRLKDKGITTGIEGTGTRVLRHFWYEGESIVGVDMGEGQELDKRVQLFYALSLVAFHSGQPYWGYRFAANAVHYLEDLTQPFHIQPIMNGAMAYEIDVLRGALCDWRRANPRQGETGAPPNCGPEVTLQNGKIRSGWLTSTYHSMYEEFGRALVALDQHGTHSELTDPGLSHEHADGIQPFPENYDAE
ncbi:MAG: hypothetical protein ACXWP5_07430, partial [Bdellovibrionota bacterium]